LIRRALIPCTRALALLLPATLALAASSASRPAAPVDRVDLLAMTRIRDEGLNRSKVMDTASQICDAHGPRLTGSPNYKRAAVWAKKQLADWGLANAHLESFAPFGRGWSYERATLRMLAPIDAAIPVIPRAWTPGTAGVVKGQAIKAKLEKDEDLEKWKGKLTGKLVLADDVPEIKPHDKADAHRHTDDELDKLAQFEVGARGRYEGDRDRGRKEYQFRKKLMKWLEEEKPLAMLSTTARADDGTIFVQGGGARKVGEPIGPPWLAVGAEGYGRIARLLDRKVDVELELEVAGRFHDEDPDACSNVVAEIPGTDKKLADEVVVIGAHYDSWHGGTGATDNGAGSAVVMEAMRILKAIDARPRRTVRVVLWGGEEQGLLGSRDYVSKHYASRPEPQEPEEREMPSYLRRRQNTGPLTFKPEHAKVAAYFNLDNGTGRVRGVYCQENAAVVPIFEEWLQPFRDLGATTVTMRRTGGTDHLSFDAVGLPGFQFLQDDLDYETRTHHSNVDTYERLQKADLAQASVLMAAFAYNAAMRDEMLPRKPIPPDPPALPEKDEQKPREEKKPDTKPEEKAKPVAP